MLTIPEAERAWSMLADTVVVPRNEKDYENLVELLDELTDEVGDDESHPLASMMEVIGVLIERYEDEHVPEL
jgi:HTH-type transcriptional regulator / antitoxin HigA